MIIGPCGAGKSVLSRALAAITGLPLHHMDRMFWSAGWAPSTREELIAKLRPVVASPRWIIDGNYGGTMPMRLARADTIVFLDYPRRIYLRRVLLRIPRSRWQARPDIPEGCPEHLDSEFLRYVWRFHVDARPRALAHLRQRPADATMVWLHHPREAKRYLASLARAHRSPPDADGGSA